MMNDELLRHFFSLEGRRGIVTGASSGIGLAVASLLADAGATVYNLSRSERYDQTQDYPVNPGIIHIQTDLNDPEQTRNNIEKITTEGPLDFLINNAGITSRVKAEEVTPEWWRQIHALNVDAPFLISQCCFSALKNSSHIGRIVNISSMAAHLGFSEVSPYCSTKAAIAGMTRALAVEWASQNILVNAVAPGWIKTNMTSTVADPERLQKILNRMPLHRYGHARNELATAVWFLVSDAAKYITGQEIAVDGGALSYGF
ncbi:SDR family NAD(P)-dependent oxidoreductase [Citrobacter portucalensis]|uniref:SDR family NAD(P)-dependent oxidoreductase n=1 Tax=Citrobacter portucalensis TaxID=1639133 RepID=UPI00226B6763|nr:SDR family oxidoreductase [Citrobacter portucalensis]MCX8985712.1 SDR family oxidoreductase [Citrobacter portucalensis]MCX9059009.1 SDR family oxidoreductase [Citrobacter portucalensis]